MSTFPMWFPCAINLKAFSTSSRSYTVVCRGWTTPVWMPAVTKSETVSQSGFPGSKSASNRIPWNETLRRKTAIPAVQKKHVSPQSSLNALKTSAANTCMNTIHATSNVWRLKPVPRIHQRLRWLQRRRNAWHNREGIACIKTQCSSISTGSILETVVFHPLPNEVQELITANLHNWLLY